MRNVVIHAVCVTVTPAIVICGIGSSGSAAPDQMRADPTQARPASAPATQANDAAILRTPVPEMNLNRVPVSDAIDGLSDLTGVSFTINDAALVAAGVKRGTPATFNGQNVTVAEALDAILQPLAAAGVTYRADGTAVWVSTRADLDHLDAFRKRHAGGPFAALDVAARPPAVDPAGARAANERPNVWTRPAGFKEIFAELSRTSGVEIRADFDTLGVTSRKAISLQLRNPTVRDALTEVLWKTGRIDDLDLEIEEKTITVVSRRQPAGT